MSVLSTSLHQSRCRVNQTGSYLSRAFLNHELHTSNVDQLTRGIDSSPGRTRLPREPEIRDETQRGAAENGKEGRKRHRQTGVLKAVVLMELSRRRSGERSHRQNAAAGSTMTFEFGKLAYQLHGTFRLESKR